MESREMLGETVKVRKNGLCSSPVTRPRRSPRIRVKLPRVMCHDAGHEKTVADVITLHKNNRRIEHLGLTLAEKCGRATGDWAPSAHAGIRTWTLRSRRSR